MNKKLEQGRKLGYKSTCKYIWHACEVCGRERWVKFTKGKPQSVLCRSCSVKKRDWRGDNSPNWAGGKYESPDGYVFVWVSKDSPYHLMANSKHYVLEHRLIMAQSLGRCITRKEHVHHINGIRNANQRENLELLSPANHLIYKQMCKTCNLCKEIRQLHVRIKEFEKEAQERMSWG